MGGGNLSYYNAIAVFDTNLTQKSISAFGYLSTYNLGNSSTSLGYDAYVVTGTYLNGNSNVGGTLVHKIDKDLVERAWDPSPSSQLRVWDIALGHTDSKILLIGGRYCWSTNAAFQNGILNIVIAMTDYGTFSNTSINVGSCNAGKKTCYLDGFCLFADGYEVDQISYGNPTSRVFAISSNLTKIDLDSLNLTTSEWNITKLGDFAILVGTSRTNSGVVPVVELYNKDLTHIIPHQ